MGRRKKNQDTAAVVNTDFSVNSQNNQLQVTSTHSESANTSETPKIVVPVEEIPYDERPIPEAYFPPEDDASQEFMPEPHIQQTVTPVAKVDKTISKKALDALKFDIKPVETKPAETTKAEVKQEKAEVTPKAAETKTEVKNNPVATNDIDFTALQFEKYINVSKNDSSKSIKTDPTSDGLADKSIITASDSLIAKNDSIASDSLAKDTIAFIPTPIPEPKRDIVSIQGKEMPENIHNMWWYTPVLLAVFIAYIIIFRDRKKAIFSELESFIKPNTDGSIFGIQWLQNSKYKFVLSLLGIVVGSLYLFLAKNAMISAIWMFFLAVTLFVVGKKLMLSLLEYIYFERADVASMSNSFMVLVRQTGMLLIPSVLGLSFAPEAYRSIFIYLGIFIVGLAIFAFNFKIIVNFLRGFTSIFYLILYLCTLEVIPVAIFFVLGLLPQL